MHRKANTMSTEEHKEIPAHDGPGYCTGCDWESRQIGISSTIQHTQHVKDVTP